MQAYAPFLERFGQQHRGLAAEEFEGSAVGSTLELKTGRPSAATRDAEIARAALRDLPEGTSHGAAPPLSHVYLSPAHRKALDPDVLLVTGMRGAGKTFWWSALQQASIRELLALDSRQRLFSEAAPDVRPGFGVVEAPNFYPGPDEIRTIIASGSRHRDIWRTVHAHQLAEAGHSLKALDSWSRRVMSMAIENATLLAIENATLFGSRLVVGSPPRPWSSRCEATETWVVGAGVELAVRGVSVALA